MEAELTMEVDAETKKCVLVTTIDMLKAVPRRSLSHKRDATLICCCQNGMGMKVLLCTVSYCAVLYGRV